MSDGELLTNQQQILRNQATIEANQASIQENQRVIQENQEKLNAIIRNQEQIIANQEKLLGEGGEPRSTPRPPSLRGKGEPKRPPLVLGAAHRTGKWAVSE